MSHARVESLERRLFLAAHAVILGNSVQIASGDTTPSKSDYTDFGYNSTNVNTFTVQRTFTIKNTGNAVLPLRGASPVQVSGGNASSFSVAQQPFITITQSGNTTIQPVSTIAAGQSASFTVTFAPAIAGANTTTLSIAYGASYYYRFTVSGTGLTTLPTQAASSVQYHVTQPAPTMLTPVNVGQVAVVDYTGYLLTGKIFDSSVQPGRSPLSGALVIATPGNNGFIAGWVDGISGMVPGETRVLMIPADMAYGSTVQNGIPANSPLIFEVTLLGVGMGVEANSQSIYNGQTAIHAVDYTDFGQASTGQTISKTFKLIGTSNVQVTLSGDNADQFSYSLSDSSLTVTYHPTATSSSAHQAEVEIDPADSSIPSYQFAISGKPITQAGISYTYESLTVNGAADIRNTITLAYADSAYNLQFDGTSYAFPAASGMLSAISISGDSKDDIILVDRTITVGASITGGDGNDSLAGGSGNDTISGGKGADTISGGAGSDTVTYNDTGRLLGVNVSLNGAAGDGSSEDGTGSGRYPTKPADFIKGDIENVTGTDFADTLIGNSGANVLEGEGGNDSIRGGSGNDSIGGGSGDDTLIGDAGNDLFYGEDGNDSISGGVGNDTLNGGNGNDTLTGDAGNDWVYGNDGNDSISGGAGNDTMFGGLGADVLSGGAGYDLVAYVYEYSGANRTKGVLVTLDNVANDGSSEDSTSGTGTAGDNVMDDVEIVYGTDFGDTLIASTSPDSRHFVVFYGQGGDDSLVGGDGNDYLSGADGNDTLSGGKGNDSLSGGTGADSMIGGDGTDVVYYSDDIVDNYGYAARTAGVNVNEDGLANDGSSQDSATVNNVTIRDNVAADIEVIVGTPFGDTLVGSNGYIHGLYGEGGDDSLVGGNKNDTLSGADGNDTLDGGLGSDTLYGGNGTDTITYDDASRTHGVRVAMTAGGGRGSTADDGRGDLLVDSFEQLIGTQYNDTLTGTPGADSIQGLAGDDSINGGTGNDTLIGGDGNDILIGGVGADSLAGGAGNDTYYARDRVADTITDSSGNDSAQIDSTLDVAPGIETLLR